MAITSDRAARAAAAVYLLLPQIPMLFMGEEWAADQPFPFFCDFGPELAKAVRDGRRQEFARFPEFQDAGARGRIPDPNAEETFLSAKLVWSDILWEPHASWLDWYRRVLAVRHSVIIPCLKHIRTAGQYEVLGNSAVAVRWPIGDSGSMLALTANLSSSFVRVDLRSKGHVLWQEGHVSNDGILEPFAVRWSVEDHAA
jgi:1,4-alpha-glucan branching enzyme